jgi:hypothetical protein
MRNVQVLLHHRAGAADLVADHLAEIGRQQAVDRVRNPVSFGFGPRRGSAGKRLQRHAMAAGGGDGFGGRESVVHLSKAINVIASEAKQSMFSLRGEMDCFASLAMTVQKSRRLEGIGCAQRCS